MSDLALNLDRCSACAVLDAAPHAFCVIADERFRYVNAAALRLFGAASAADVLGARMLDRIAPEDAPVAIERLREVLNEGRRWHGEEVTFVRFDGERLGVEVECVRVQFAGGPAVLASARDISQRKSLEASEQKLRTIFDTMSEGVALNEIVYDANGVMVDYRVIEVNDAFAKIADRAPGNPVGRLATELYGMPSEMITDFWRAHRLRNTVQRTEFVSPISHRTFAISTSPFHGDRFVTAFFDITEQRRLSEAFRQTQKLESIGRLAGGVAHDFNNLLTVIFGNLEIAMASMPPGTEGHAAVVEAQRAAQRSSALTRQLLAFARRTPIEPRRLEVNEAIADSLKMLGRLIGEHIALEWRPEPACGAVLADPGQLDQILVNLCINARDAITGTGQIVLSTAACRIDEPPVDAPDAAPGDYVRVSMADSGAGIAADVLPYIFEPFFTTKAPGAGTGLGLATVFGAVKQHGGFITVESRVGQGTTFHVHLPRAAESAGDKDQADHRTVTTANRPTDTRATILVVEDESAILEMVALALKLAGYSVVKAGRPEEALALADAYPDPIDLLLTDVIMPGGSGPALAAELVQRRPGLRVLFMTGYESLEFGGEMSDGSRIVRKPFTIEELKQRVRRALTEPTA